MNTQTKQEAYLEKNRAWNWLWPDNKGRWYTKAPKRCPSQAYTGPSKRVKARRERRRKERKSHV